MLLKLLSLQGGFTSADQGLLQEHPRTGVHQDCMQFPGKEGSSQRLALAWGICKICASSVLPSTKEQLQPTIAALAWTVASVGVRWRQRWVTYQGTTI